MDLFSPGKESAKGMEWNVNLFYLLGDRQLISVCKAVRVYLRNNVFMLSIEYIGPDLNLEII